MLFTSLEFMLFFPVVVVLYFLTGYSRRWMILLGASYFFYAYYNPSYTVLLVASTLVDYFAAIYIAKTTNAQKKNFYLAASVILNLGLLFYFKYFNFFNHQVEAVLNALGFAYEAQYHRILLPLGISFYTFQTLSYTIDVYKGRTKPEYHLGKYALYVSFFPQLVAGPIERASNLLKQFHFKYDFEYDRVVGGMQLILWGFFKKLVIADRIGVLISPLFADPHSLSGLEVWGAVALFIFQIFCDFSAYSEIAMGLALILGVKLSKNFENRVYAESSVTRLWRGWHITLTSWVRDYVFFPLVLRFRGYNLNGLFILLMFTIIGLWHGADWTLVIWGCLNGFFIVYETMATRWLKKLPGDKSWMKTKAWHYIRVFKGWSFSMLGALFFRAHNVDDAITLLARSTYLGQTSFYPRTFFTNYGMAIFVILVMDLMNRRMGKNMIHQHMKKEATWFRWSFYIFITYLVLYYGINNSMEFIYFDF